jgi:two-component system LytT family response regulator
MLLLSTSAGIEMIQMDTIVRIEAISNYSKLFFANGKTLVVAKVLRWFEERLPGMQFIRVHRTHIINRKYLLAYHYERNGYMQLANGESIEVARRKKIYVRGWLYAYAHVE